MRRSWQKGVRLVLVTAIAGSVALASIDTGTRPVTSLAPQSTGGLTATLTPPPPTRVTTTSASPVIVPLSLSLSGFDADRNVTATVTLSGTSPGTLRLDDAGLTVTATTALSGVTVVSFRGTTTSVAAALTTGRLAWEVPEQPGEVTLSATVRQDLPPNTAFNPTNGHYYQRDQLAQGWFSARTRSESRSLWGLTGYLATITSASEQAFLAEWITTGNWWLGASDDPEVGASQGAWKWVTGPESERVQFWQGLANGFAVEQRYTAWLNNQPNNDTGGLFGSEQDFAEFQGFGDTSDGWNDVTRDDQNGGLVEFGLADGTIDDRGEVTVTATLTAVSRFVDLMTYADANSGTAPDAAEWHQTTVTGVDTEIFAGSLATVLASSAVTSSAVDTLPAAQGLVDSYRRVLDYASTTGGSSAPTEADYLRLGLGELSNGSVSLMNQRVAASGVPGVDSYAGLMARLAEALAPPPPPVLPDLTMDSSTSTSTTVVPDSTTTTVPATTVPTTVPATSVPATTIPATSVPSTTVVTTTTLPEQAVPQLVPVPQHPDGTPVVSTTGEAVLLVDGVVTDVTLRAVDPLTVEASSGDLTVRLGTRDPDGTPLPIEGGTGLRATLGGTIELTGDGFAPGGTVELWAFSTPVQLGSAVATSTGELSARVIVPNDLGAGFHTLQILDFTPAGEERALSVGLTVTEPGSSDTTPEPVPTSAPDPTPTTPENESTVPADNSNGTSPAREPFAAFTALDEPQELVETAVSVLAVVAAASAAGAAAGAAGAAARAATPGSPDGAGEASTTTSDEAGYVEAVGALHLEAAVDQHVDRWPWIARLPGTQLLDSATREATRWLAPRSPLLERVVGDASTWRALLGSGSLLFTVIAVGAAFAVDVGEPALSPAWALMAVLMMVGALDALSGAVGFAVIAIRVAATGGIDDPADLRSLLGLAAAIMGPGLVAKAFRPPRRPPSTSLAQWWERLGDLAVLPLMGGLVAQGIVWGLNGMAGVYLPITDHAPSLASLVMAVLVVHVIAEEGATRWLPGRITAVTPSQHADPTLLRQTLSVVVSTAVYVFVVIAFLGNVWQLWVAAALYTTPLLLSLVSDRLPNSTLLWKLLPQGVPFMVTLLWGGVILAGWVEGWLGETPDYARTSFVVLAAFPTALALLGAVGREPDDGLERWHQHASMRHVYRLGGIAMLVAGVQISV